MGVGEDKEGQAEIWQDGVGLSRIKYDRVKLGRIVYNILIITKGLSFNIEILYIVTFLFML